ncbi:unnamed protein product, partial [Didymodactylos carnosus]
MQGTKSWQHKPISDSGSASKITYNQ